MAAKKRAKKGSHVFGKKLREPKAQVIVVDVTNIKERKSLACYTVYANPATVAEVINHGLTTAFGGKE